MKPISLHILAVSTSVFMLGISAPVHAAGGSAVARTTKGFFSRFGRLFGKKAAPKAVSNVDDGIRVAKRGALVFVRSADAAAPVAKAGTQAIRLAANPKLEAQVIATFGKDGARLLAKAPPNDVSKLLRIAGRTQDETARKILLAGYAKSADKSRFLRHLTWKTLAAGTLGTAAIIAAYQLTDGAQAVDLAQAEGMEELAREHPELFARLVEKREASSFGTQISRMVAAAIGVFLLLCLIPAAIWSFGRARALWRTTMPAK